MRMFLYCAIVGQISANIIYKRPRPTPDFPSLTTISGKQTKNYVREDTASQLLGSSG